MTNISYNLLNLPMEVSHSDGSMEKYVYSADGIKQRVTNSVQAIGIVSPMTRIMRKSSSPGNGMSTVQTIDYCGNVIYDNNMLSSIQVAGGYITLNGTASVYHYYITDHEGNNRVVADAVGGVEQVNHYYPFGALFGDCSGSGTQRYKYNGKELDRMHGKNLYDYGARNYDAAIIRWTTMDPLCDKYYHVSPYVYYGDNPINAIDPDGCDSIYYNQDGKELYHCGEDFASTTIYGVNTTKTTNELYNDGSYQNKQKGKSYPITQEQYNNGILDPNSIRKEAEKGDDFFINDLFEISNSDKMIEMYANKTNTYLDEKGNKQSNVEWGTAPYIANDYGPTAINYLKANGQPIGVHVQGCTGQTLLPLSNIPRRSTNNNIQVIIYNSNITNCMTVGIAHEFGHVLLYLHHKPSEHGHPGVDDFVYGRATKMSRRLGYDY